MGLPMVGLVDIGKSWLCWKRSHLKRGAEKTTWCSVDCAFRVGFWDVNVYKVMRWVIIKSVKAVTLT